MASTTTAATGFPIRRPVVPGPRGGKTFIPAIQRERLLDAAAEMVAEGGVRGLRAKPVAARAGMSPKTFYDLFADSEDCFLALFDRAVEWVATVVRPVHECESEWTAGIRSGLGTLLAYLDADPQMCDLVFVQALGAGPRVLERRTEVLDVLARAVDEARQTNKGRERSPEPPPLTAESVVGAAFTVIHTRVCQQDAGGLSDLLNPLMAMIVLPYRGRAAANRELNRRSTSKQVSAPVVQAEELPTDLSIRLTHRTVGVLQAVAENPGAGNRVVREAAGVVDQGQISKLLHRLERHGLLQNTGIGRSTNETNEWSLTPCGEEVVRHAA
jgi:AcrR family transcriptional regulator/DNA-binding MarR family transcriptional regulator